MAAYYTRPLGNIIATEAGAMAKVRLTIDHIKTGKYVLNVESVGLTQDQVFRLCGDNPELRLELTAQKEIIVKELQFKLDECRKWRDTRISDLSATTPQQLDNLNPCVLIPNSQASPWTWRKSGNNAT
jgi:hypothetical protein